ncbi:MAG: hypothetical protein NC911_06265 [Candidatus Omnitrophica bacterium]|nr:hypothetical protein [Candidatus Omnitrophota bacterium]MCM8769264.1 hypothetical protein [Candidatus Omnitrophota bacterium]
MGKGGYVRNILRRSKVTMRNKGRKIFYPGIWIYDQEVPFRCGQVDTNISGHFVKARQD